MTKFDGCALGNLGPLWIVRLIKDHCDSVKSIL